MDGRSGLPAHYRQRGGTGHIEGGRAVDELGVRKPSGRKLALNYQLVGAGGAYQMVSQDRSHRRSLRCIKVTRGWVGQVRVWVRQHLFVLMASTSHVVRQAESGGLYRSGRAGIEAGRSGPL